MGVRDEGGSWVRGCLLELPSTRERAQAIAWHQEYRPDMVAEAIAHAAEDVPEVMQVRSGLGDYICHR